MDLSKLPFAILTEDAGVDDTHVWSMIPTTVFPSSNIFALDCTPNRRYPPRPRIPKPNIFTGIAKLDATLFSLFRKEKKSPKLVLFYGYHIDLPGPIRSTMYNLLLDDADKYNVSIVVFTDNVERHRIMLRTDFTLVIQPNPQRVHHCSRCRQPRDKQYVIKYWASDEVAFDECCDKCRNLTNDEVPGGVRFENCSCHHSKTLNIACLVCRKTFGCNYPNNDLFCIMTRETLDITKHFTCNHDHHAEVHNAYCSKRCQEVGKRRGFHAKTCYVCDKENATVCGQCEAIYYCGVECQQSDWERHKESCNVYILDP